MKSVLQRSALLLMLLLFSVAAWSHGPTRQKVIETVEINAPADKVWALIGDFAGWHQWHPAIESSSADKGNTPGSMRKLNIKGGKHLMEELKNYDAAGMKMKYVITSGDALPVTNYSSKISVKAKGDDKCEVKWLGAFYRGYPNNDPPPELNDEAAVKAVTGVYQLGLSNLKTIAEK